MLLGLFALARGVAAVTLLVSGGKVFSIADPASEWKVLVLAAFGLIMSLIGVIGAVAVFRNLENRWTFVALFLVLYPVVGVLNGLLFFGQLVTPDIFLNSVIAIIVGAFFWLGQRMRTPRMSHSQ
jgi:hypothetical protein